MESRKNRSGPLFARCCLILCIAGALIGCNSQALPPAASDSKVSPPSSVPLRLVVVGDPALADAML